MSLDESLVERLLNSVEAGQEEIGKIDSRWKGFKGQVTTLKNYVYEEWDFSKFKPEDRKTWPNVLQKEDEVLSLLDNLNVGIGYAHKMVTKYRYPDQRPPIVIEARGAEGGQEAPRTPVQVFTGTQQGVEEGGRVRGWWAGWHDRAIERMKIQYQRERDERVRNQPESLTETVVRDPVEVGNELRSLINETKDFVTDCFLCLPYHMNMYFARNVHESFRKRVTKLVTAVESVTKANFELEKDERQEQILAQTGLFTRILEAQAMGPSQTTIYQQREGYGGGGVPRP